jgi:hypothetical protein
VVCGSDSVVVSTPSSFKETIFYKINKNVQAIYMFDNFTTDSHSDCPIISHRLAITPFNTLSPAYISIIQNKELG